MILIVMGLCFIFQACIYFSYQELYTVSLSIWKEPICSFTLHSKSYMFFKKWQQKHTNYHSKKKLVSTFPFKHIPGYQHKMTEKANKTILATKQVQKCSVTHPKIFYEFGKCCQQMCIKYTSHKNAIHTVYQIIVKNILQVLHKVGAKTRGIQQYKKRP